ncbi:achaete-scute homolog 4 [Ctenodactylus gundi]
MTEKRKAAGLQGAPRWPRRGPRLPSGGPLGLSARADTGGPEPALLRKRNERERQRVRGVNEGYARLRDHLPRELAGRRLSKVETLRAAIGYIKHLQALLERPARGPEGALAATAPCRADCNSDGESKASSAPSPCSEPEDAGS